MLWVVMPSVAGTQLSSSVSIETITRITGSAVTVGSFAGHLAVWKDQGNRRAQTAYSAPPRTVVKYATLHDRDRLMPGGAGPERGPSGHLPALDGARGIAILIVLVHNTS